VDQPWLWLSQQGRLTSDGIRQMLERRGQAIDVRLHAHMFRHGFADAWLKAGGAEGDLQELAGWRSRAMLRRYAARQPGRAGPSGTPATVSNGSL
jgi:integrase